MKKILSIDDSAHTRRVIRGAAEVLGHGFLEAQDGETGIQTLKDFRRDIELVVLDVNMPGMLGFEVLKVIKADPGLRAVPVMMVTTECEGKAIVGAIKAGAANYITKPFGPEELVIKMAETLNMVGEGP